MKSKDNNNNGNGVSVFDGKWWQKAQEMYQKIDEVQRIVTTPNANCTDCCEDENIQAYLENIRTSMINGKKMFRELEKRLKEIEQSFYFFSKDKVTPLGDGPRLVDLEEDISVDMPEEVESR